MQRSRLARSGSGVQVVDDTGRHRLVGGRVDQQEEACGFVPTVVVDEHLGGCLDLDARNRGHGNFRDPFDSVKGVDVDFVLNPGDAGQFKKVQGPVVGVSKYWRRI